MKREFKIPLVIIDIFAFAFIGMMAGFLLFGSLSYNSHLNDSLMLGLFLPFFIILFTGFGFYIYLEHKYNQLKLKTVFFYLMIVIVITNIIAVCCLPSTINLPNEATMSITSIMRVYFLMVGCAAGALPYLWFYLVPRKILHRHYMDIVLYLILGIVAVFIVLSFITEWDKYIRIFTEGLSVLDDSPLISICGNKGYFSRVLLMGIFASFLLRIRQRKWQWILLSIPLFFLLCLTYSKIIILLTILLFIIYIIIRLVMVCRNDKNNKIITMLIVGFCILLLPLFIIGIIRSESGLLFEVKNLFIGVAKSSQTTFESRLIIWKCSFQLLAPYQYIFGFGTNTFGLALRYTYAPVAPVWESTEYFCLAHNIFIEWIGEGGIILLGTYLFLHIYLIKVAIEMRKKCRWLSIMSIAMVIFYVTMGVVSSIHICTFNDNFMMGAVIILPIMSEYYIYKDKDERNFRKCLMDNANKISAVKTKSKISSLNKMILLSEIKHIKSDFSKKL